MSSIKPGKYPGRNSIIPHKHESVSEVNEHLKKEVEKIICVVADKRSIPALINLLDDHEFDIRWIAAESLIRIGRRSIVPLLCTIRDGRRFSYPGKAHHVLQCLLTRSEKKALQPLLTSLCEDSGRNENAVVEASFALRRVFRYVN